MSPTFPIEVMLRAACSIVLVEKVGSASADNGEAAMRELFSFTRDYDAYEYLVAAGVIPVISEFFKNTEMSTTARLVAVDVISMLHESPAACNEVVEYGLMEDLLDFANVIDLDENESTAAIALRQITIYHPEHVRALGRVPGAVDKLKAVLDYDFEGLIKSLVVELEELELEN